MKNIDNKEDINLTKKILFNYKADDKYTKKMLLSPTSNIFNMSEVRYSWANNVCQRMRDNFWIPEKIPLNKDDVTSLTDFEYKAFRHTISFLNALDSLQASNLPRISDFFTSSSINYALGLQSFQELVHSYSYTYILNVLIVDRKERWDTYYLYKENKKLLARNTTVSDIFQSFLNKPTIKTLYKVLICALILERIYFIHGFIFFYALYAYKKVLPGSKEIIELIHRDENSHGFLDVHLINQFQKEFPEHVCDDKVVYNLFQQAIDSELEWFDVIYRDKIVGMSHSDSKKFLQFLTNRLLININLKPMFSNNINPYEELLSHVDTFDEASIKGNFFETTVTNYNISTVLEDPEETWKKFDQDQKNINN